MSLEGVIKFQQEFRKKEPLDFNILVELDFCRNLLYNIRLIGQDKNKYSGAGYGNVSMRLNYENIKNKRKFVITGTQTGHFDRLNENHYATVLEYYPEKNFIVCEGPIMASSESMTHGTIYDLDDTARFVFHVHSPEIWKYSRELEIPETKESVEYGTPELAEEVKKLFEKDYLNNIKIFSIKGHEDGVVSFGKTSKEAVDIIIDYLIRSRKFVKSDNIFYANENFKSNILY